MRSEEIYRYSRSQGAGGDFVCVSEAICPQTQFHYTDTAAFSDPYRLYAALPFLGRWSWPSGAQLYKSNNGCGDLLVLFSGQITVSASGRTHVLKGGERLILHDRQYTVAVDGPAAADLLLLSYSGSLCESLERVFAGQARTAEPCPMTEALAQLLQEAAACMETPAAVRPMAAAHVAVRLLTALYTHSPQELCQTGAEPQRFLAARHFLETHYRQKVSVETLAEVCGCSVSHFHRLFRAYTGVTPYQYLLRLRIDHARQLLEQEHFSVKYVSYAVGFSAPNHFIRYFKQQTGFTPDMYAQLCRNAAAKTD